jgi:N-acetylmuramic acid 6-phosphate etherase
MRNEFEPRSRGIDVWSDTDILAAIVDGQAAALRAVRAAIPAIEAAVAAAVLRLRSGSGRLIYAGAGTPARLAVQDGVELIPTYGWPRERLAFLVAGGEKALTRAMENAEDDTGAARRDVQHVLKCSAAGDTCIAVSASGETPYTVEVSRLMRQAGALTIGISSVKDSALLKRCDHPIFIDSGPEPVGGSTRMNAGTAQKATLNAISTLMMIRLGRVYDGFMVDVELNNAKLRERARGMVREIAGCNVDEAGRALEAAGGHAKLAVLVAKGLPPAAAEGLLNAHGGDLRDALKRLSRPEPLRS